MPHQSVSRPIPVIAVAIFSAGGLHFFSTAEAKTKCHFCPPASEIENQLQINCVSHRFEQLGGPRNAPVRSQLEGISASVNEDYYLTYEWVQQVERTGQDIREQVRVKVGLQEVTVQNNNQGGLTEKQSDGVQVLGLICRNQSACAKVESAVRTVNNQRDESANRNAQSASKGLNLICRNPEVVMRTLSTF